MAYTQADLDRIEAAIASEELEVETPEGSRTRYRSMSELIEARDEIRAGLAAAAPVAARAPVTMYPRFGTSRD